MTSTHQQALTPAQIDRLVAKTIKTFDVPGIAVAVIKDDKIVLSKGYGVRSLNTRLKVDAQTLFGIASNTKAFTAAALAMLVDEKKIQWTGRITEYIPEFKMYNPYVTEEFTVMDLLTHRSGLGLGAGDLMLFPDGGDFTRADIIRSLRHLKPASSFRSQFDYDNILYIVAGEIVPRVCGISFEEFIESRIMQPLGMTDSAASLGRLKKRSNVSDAHAPVKGVVQVIKPAVGEISNAAGGIASNIADMSHWVKMQLNGGAYGDGMSQRMFSASAQRTMWSPHTMIPMPDGGPNTYDTHFCAYGLGWSLLDVKGYKKVSHTGGLAGMTSQVTLIPEMMLGIIVLTNQQAPDAFRAITDSILDGYLGMPRIDRIGAYHKRLLASGSTADTKTHAIWESIRKQRRSGGASRIDLTSFVGTYRDNWFGDVDISLNGRKLGFKSNRSPTLTGEMYFYKGNTFAVKWNGKTAAWRPMRSPHLLWERMVARLGCRWPQFPR
jgi:CubicO group peptidase (beta-lactamase class C family)